MGLASYSSQDAARFFGRESEARLLMANAIASAITVVYGPSGVGKSSLLNAGLVAECVRAGVDIALQREWHAAAFSSFVERFSTRPSLSALQAGSKKVDGFSEAGCSAQFALRVIVLDQFEEYFLNHDDDHALHRWLEVAFALEASFTHIVIGIRDDALSLLDRLSDAVPDVLGNLIRIDPLSPDQAVNAFLHSINAFNAQYPTESIEVDSILLRSIVEGTASDNEGSRSLGIPLTQVSSRSGRTVQLPYIQLVLDRLWEIESAAGSRHLGLDTLSAHGGAARIVLSHIDAVVSSMSSKDREASYEILRFLVSPGGTKLTLTSEDASEFAGIASATAKRVMHRLSEPDSRLLRQLRTSDSVVLYYELFHDFLVAPVLTWRRDFEAHMLRDWKRNFRRRWLIPGTLIGLAIASLLAMVAEVQRREARSEADRALTASKAATRARADAEQARIEAEDARVDADLARSRIEEAFEFRQRLYSADSDSLAQLLNTIPRDDQIEFSMTADVRQWQCEGGEPAYLFSLQPEDPDIVRQTVAVITYYFDHPTFLSPSMTASPLNKFIVQWNGCGLIDRIYAIQELEDPGSAVPFKYNVVNMHVELWDQFYAIDEK